MELFFLVDSRLGGFIETDMGYEHLFFREMLTERIPASISPVRRQLSM